MLVPGAYPSALGGAFCAKADDVCAVCYNPAGIYQISDFQLTGYYGGIVNMKRNSWGISILNNFTPYLTTAFSGVTSINEDYKIREDSYILTLGIPLINDNEKEFGAGFNLKYLYAVYESKASALSADIGILYKIKNILSADSINFGFSIQDMQSSIRWSNGQEEKIPLLIKTGFAFISKNLFNLMMDIDIINDKNYKDFYKTLIKFGIEKNIEFISLRVGYSGFETVLSSISLGLGVLTKNFRIDYSFLNHVEELGTTHKIDLKFIIPRDNIVLPLKVEVFPGDEKVYIKWLSSSGKPDIYRVYIESEKGLKIIKEKPGESEEANFLIENLENGIKYSIEIYAVYNGKEKEKSEKIEVIPHRMNEKIKMFYKNAKMLYINNKYAEAIKELKEAEKIDAKNADIVMLKEKIKKLVKGKE